MLISTRGRYALRVLLDLAEHLDLGFTPMKDVAERQQISLKYLEKILPVLVKNNYVVAAHGKGGGYRLAKLPEKCNVGEILRLTENKLAPVACLSCKTISCPRESQCKTLQLWKKFHSITNNFFDGISLKDIMEGTFE